MPRQPAPLSYDFGLSAVLGASSWQFATPLRSARGTDRDIPASFLRS